MNRHENECLSYISGHASTWCPIEEIGFDPEDDIQNDIFVQRVHQNKKFITFPYYKELEEKTAKKVVSRIGHVPIDSIVVNNFISQYEKSETEKTGREFRLAKEQREGVLTLLSNRLAILTGGPGTGKTSVLKCLVYVIYAMKGLSVIDFTAPTGKAARRITESTGYPAMTLQRRIGDAGMEINTLSLTAPDFLIIDEASMIDLETFFNLLVSLKCTTRLFLVGDVDQLPSVGIGAVLRDLIDSGMIPYCQLEQCFRQDDSSMLSTNIQIVKDGGHFPLQEGPDFKRIKTEKDILQNILSEYTTAVSKYGVDEVAVLTPYRKTGLICSEKLNNILQRLMNPDAQKKGHAIGSIQRDGRVITLMFAEGDPVIQLKNTNRVANGDIGKIIKAEEKKITVEFSDCVIDYYPNTFWQLDLAYSMSVHKSQGSEYKCVILPLMKENRNLDRNLIYTGITRAKKECVVIGEDAVIQRACKIQSSWERTTFLCEEMQFYLVKARFLATLNLMSVKENGA